MGFIVVKCHECGNAFKIDFDYKYSVEFNTDGKNIKKYHNQVEKT